MKTAIDQSVETLATAGVKRVCRNSEALAEPAVPVEESITHDYLIGLNDAQKLRALERYLQGKYSRSEQYREKWRLPSD